MGDFHYGVVVFHECRFILGHRFFRRLLLIVREDALNSLIVPSRGKSTLVHIRLVRLLRKPALGVPPKTLDSLTAISGEIPRFSFTSSDKVVRVTPSAAAAAVIVKPKGSTHRRSTKPPGWGISVAASLPFSNL